MRVEGYRIENVVGGFLWNPPLSLMGVHPIGCRGGPWAHRWTAAGHPSTPTSRGVIVCERAGSARAADSAAKPAGAM